MKNNFSDIRYIPTTSYEFSVPVGDSDYNLTGYKPAYRPVVQSEAPPQETVSEESAPKESKHKETEPNYGYGVFTQIVDPYKSEKKKKKSSSETSQSERYSDKSKFVRDLTDAYTKELTARGIDEKYARMLVAQDALESAWGSKYAGNYNFGNIAVPNGVAASYTEGGDHDANGNPITHRFRNYKSLEEWVKAKIDLLSRSRYNAFSNPNDDAQDFYTRIKKGGYAEDPEYVSKLLNIYNGQLLSVKIGGSIPSRIDILTNKLNKILYNVH